MKIWLCNWADVADADCINDDGIDTEILATPSGVLFVEFDVAKLQKLIDDDREGLYDGEEELPDDEMVLRVGREDYREYVYGDTLVMCSLKEVM